jgi:uncharacterized protein (TIGR02391 family)
MEPNRLTIDIGRRLSSDLAEYSAEPQTVMPVTDERMQEDPPLLLAPKDALLADFDARILDVDLRAATRTRFVSEHFADAVEAGVKALNECVRAKSGRTEDGDGLMTLVFSPGKPLLRINKGRSKSDESAQRGHMQLCQGVVSAWRNPRAHTITDDSPTRALMMLEVINDLIETTKGATRTRRPRPKP